MIIDAIIVILLEPVQYLLELLSLPVVDNLKLDEDIFDMLLEICRPLGYVLPIKTFLACLAFSFALDHFNIIWSMFLRLKSFGSVSTWTN